MKTVLEKKQPHIPKRFQPSKTILWIDRFMNRFIGFGGALIIAAVMGIFVFILWQIFPLFHKAEVSTLKEVALEKRDYRLLGVDEWGERPFVVDQKGEFLFVDLVKGQTNENILPPYDSNKEFSAFKYKQRAQQVILGTEEGSFCVVKIKYKTHFKNETRSVYQELNRSSFYPISDSTQAILKIDYSDSEDKKLAVAIQKGNKRKEVRATLLKEKRSLIGTGTISVEAQFDLTSQIKGEPISVLVNEQADQIFVATKKEVYFFSRKGRKIVLSQAFSPFQNLEATNIASIDFLLGDSSIVITNDKGANRIFSFFIPLGEKTRTLDQTKEFASLAGPITTYSASLRNKAFLIGSQKNVSLRYATTEKIRWQKTLPYSVSLSAINSKYNRILFLDTQNRLHLLKLKDPHPETSFNSFFGKIWYEGYSKPDYLWQSTGGSDEFEPKLSLIPLIIGTLKGTLYALCFSVPIALLAAIYVSQFLGTQSRAVIKPIMEIMASLPSVVLGFLAALWLAPLIEERIPSLLVLCFLIPSSALLLGWIGSSLPKRYRSRIHPGTEFLIFIPILILTSLFGWMLGPLLEKLIFVITEPSTGEKIADFRLWWPQITGTPFEQRNSLVVGFMMGFAVIPIIFTIAEDAFSNVPNSLRSASLACGASPWQTAMRVVLPTAAAGLFSAIMIGIGRAVGETMIVVMATGNTPIMDFNIFTGMRTLSANISVELPEAPHHGTLYRTLFLGAMLLFIMTFCINTVAEILRQKLRQKYKTV